MKGQHLVIILAFVIIIVSLVTILAVSMTYDLQNTPTDYVSFFTGVVVGFTTVGSAVGLLIYIWNKVRKKKKQ